MKQDEILWKAVYADGTVVHRLGHILRYLPTQGGLARIHVRVNQIDACVDFVSGEVTVGSYLYTMIPCAHMTNKRPLAFLRKRVTLGINKHVGINGEIEYVGLGVRGSLNGSGDVTRFLAIHADGRLELKTELDKET